MGVQVVSNGEIAKIGFDEVTHEAMQFAAGQSAETYANFLTQDVRAAHENPSTFTVSLVERGIYELGCTTCKLVRSCFQQRVDDVRDAMRDLTDKHLLAQESALEAVSSSGGNYEAAYRDMLVMGGEPRTPAAIGRARRKAERIASALDVPSNPYL